ncbi:MAG TPA: hypothetical protein VKV40_22545 [Ktedonobacteraceae bacterium]|nr:hypothetical protein [Ktedonobacteraceae bacterium]
MSDTHQHPLKLARLCRNLTQQGLAAQTQLALVTIKRAEAGEPLSADSRERLCRYFGKTAQELGLVGEEQAEVSSHQKSEADQLPVRASSLLESKAPSLLKGNQAISRLYATEGTLEEQLGAWLVLEADDLAQLLDEGWSLETLFESLQIVLKGVQAMPKMSRRELGRKLLQIGAAAAVSNIPISTGQHISAEDRVKLHQALSESIVSGWKLFHTAGNAQVLAVGQAQLFLVQQNHALLYSQVRPIYYAGVYNLIGRAQHLQEHYEEALQAHTNAHVAALGTGDPLYVAQSLVCLADTYQALGQHTEALQSIEEALRSLGHLEEEHVRVRAHLLCCWADNAMEMGDYGIAQKRLEEASAYLDQISPKEEFDRSSWLQLAGKLALMSGNYKQAVDYLKEALINSPPNWLVRRTSILIPLAMAYARMRERGVSLQVARQATPIIASMNAPMVNNQFVEYLRGDLLEQYPHDSEVLTFVAEAERQLSQVSSLL